MNNRCGRFPARWPRHDRQCLRHQRRISATTASSAAALAAARRARRPLVHRAVGSRQVDDCRHGLRPAAARRRQGRISRRRRHPQSLSGHRLQPARARRTHPPGGVSRQPPRASRRVGGLCADFSVHRLARARPPAVPQLRGDSRRDPTRRVRAARRERAVPRARRGEITNFTGIDDVYEPPPDPELRIDTRRCGCSDAVERVPGSRCPSGGCGGTRWFGSETAVELVLAAARTASSACRGGYRFVRSDVASRKSKGQSRGSAKPV